MKHKPIAIEFTDLVNLVQNGSDTPWRDVLCLDDEILNRMDDELCDDLAAIEREEARLIASLAGTWWRVTWPEHVLTPEYNSEANYSQCRDKAEALDGATEYGMD